MNTVTVTKKNTKTKSSYTVNQVLRVVHHLCPPALAFDWDNVGLLIGNPDAPVQRMLVALEADDRTIALAAKKKCELLLTHHPLVFRPLKSLRSDDPVARRLIALHDNGIALIASHTNFDCSQCSMNHYIASSLKMNNLIPLEARLPFRDTASEQSFYKFVVYVPGDYSDVILDAIHRGGGGTMGAYSHVSFAAKGTGTFQPEAGARPFIGKKGTLEKVCEDRVESLVAAENLAAVVDEVKRVHPYEAVAWDIYKLAISPANEFVLTGATGTGLGLVGNLPAATTLAELGASVARLCDATYPPMISGNTAKRVRKIAVMGGSGGSMLGHVLARHPDVFVTGEFGYHETLAAADRGIAVIALGHANSERLFSTAMCQALMSEDANLGGKNAAVQIISDTGCADPFMPLR